MSLLYRYMLSNCVKLVASIPVLRTSKKGAVEEGRLPAVEGEPGQEAVQGYQMVEEVVLAGCIAARSR